MSGAEDIIREVTALGGMTENNLRIVLNGYEITKKSNELAVIEDKRARALQMFFVTKRVEGCSPRTITYYQGVLKRFFTDVNCNLETVTSDVIRYYIAIRSERDRLGKVSQDNELHVLKSFFGWCTTEDYIAKDPTKNIKPIKRDQRIKKTFSEIELEKLRKSVNTKRDLAILETLYSTGCRVSELCGMDRKNIDGNEITVFGKGGKDSDCIRILAELAGVKHDIVHNLTTVDAPETVYYVRSIPNVIIEKPEKSMWQLIPDKLMPPTRLVRYCCEELKERGGLGRLKITGVRKAESRARADRSDLIQVIGKPKTTQKAADELGADYLVNDKGGLVMNMDNDPARRLVEHCYRTSRVMVNPIIDWTDNDVWEFLHHYGYSANPLYQCGESRIGCIGCPIQGFKGMKADFARYPIYRLNYVRAFDRMIKERKRRNLQRDTSWETDEDVIRWWVGDDPRQITLEDLQR